MRLKASRLRRRTVTGARAQRVYVNGGNRFDTFQNKVREYYYYVSWPMFQTTGPISR